MNFFLLLCGAFASSVLAANIDAPTVDGTIIVDASDISVYEQSNESVVAVAAPSVSADRVDATVVSAVVIENVSASAVDVSAVRALSADDSTEIASRTVFNTGDFVSLGGLAQSPSLNGVIGMIQNPSYPSPTNPNETRVQVLVAVSNNIRRFGEQVNGEVIGPKQCLKSMLVKPENLGEVAYGMARERTLDEILAEMQHENRDNGNGSTFRMPSAFHRERLSEQDIRVLDHIVQLIAALVGPRSERILTNPATYDKIRLIGAWIMAHYGFQAAVHVCKANRSYHPYIERAWNRIGQWQA